VDDDNFAGAVAVWVRVLFRRAAMRSLARVADAVDSIERLALDGFFEVAEFAGSAADVHFPVGLNDGDACGIVAAIFEAAEAVKNQRDDFFGADVTNNSAHAMFSPVMRCERRSSGRNARLA